MSDDGQARSLAYIVDHTVREARAAKPFTARRMSLYRRAAALVRLQARRRASAALPAPTACCDHAAVAHARSPTSRGISDHVCPACGAVVTVDSTD